MKYSNPKTVAILGAGPAGSATAIALLRAMADNQQSISVILLDDVANPSLDAVGETIPPAATPILRRLGCLDLLESGHHLECPGSVSIWGDDKVGHNDFLFSPIGKGYHLDRKKFDADLMARAQALGTVIRRGWRLRGVEERDRGYDLKFATKPSAKGAVSQAQSLTQRSSLLPDFVVDASGIGSAFTRRIGIARNVFDEVISVCAFFDVQATDSRPLARTLVQTQENGWWYAARIPNGKAIVSFCTDAQELKRRQPSAAAAKWRQFFDPASWFAKECEKQFDTTIGSPSRVVLKPSPSAILSTVIGNAWLAVGDAASSYDSLTSAGITKALSNGEIAGKAIAKYLSCQNRELLRDYQDSIFVGFNRYVQLHRYHYSNEQRYANSGFWRRRRANHCEEI